MNVANGRDAWAWEQIEAMADGSLRGGERRRMRAALRRDARLRAAVERARLVRAALANVERAPVPAGLLGRLLAVPPARRRRVSWALIAAPAGLAAAAVAAVMIATQPPPAQPEDPRTAAVRDFKVAMHYLQQSAAYTGEEVGGVVGAGLMGAVLAGRDSLLEESDEEDGG